MQETHGARANLSRSGGGGRRPDPGWGVSIRVQMHMSVYQGLGARVAPGQGAAAGFKQSESFPTEHRPSVILGRGTHRWRRVHGGGFLSACVAWGGGL
jgi:hypothetical protein